MADNYVSHSTSVVVRAPRTPAAVSGSIAVPYVGDTLGRKRLSRLLSPYFRLRAWTRGSDTCGRTGEPLVVASLTADFDREMAVVSGLGWRNPALHAVLVVPDRRVRARLEHMGNRSRLRPLLMNQDPDRFLAEFHSTWFLAESARLECSTYASQLPEVLLGALRVVVRSRLDAPPHTVADVADGVGVSRGYLSRTAAAYDVSLPDLTRTWLSLLAMDRRLSTHEPWDRVARRAGYASASGLTRLFRAHHGFEPSRCGREEFHGAVIRFRDRVLGVLERST